MKTTVFSKSCIGELKSSRRREDDSSVDSTVRAIIERVRKDGDKALLELSEEIDKTRLQRLAVDKEESDAAERAVPDSLKKAMETLSDREKLIISLRFGLGGNEEEKTQKEVADLLGISQSYISRLEKKIMQRLKREMVRYE